MNNCETIKCRLCGTKIQKTFANLGTQPICETYLSTDEINKKEIFYPLKVVFCSKCLLVQLVDSISPQAIFKEYSYFSSHSNGWLKHVEKYVEMIIGKLNLTSRSFIVEVGSNDGYLLQFFSEKKISTLGVEPATNVAKEALSKRIPTLVKFFNIETSKEIVEENGQADLIIANNILAHVPDLNGFVEGLKNLLNPTGVITLEFHHLLNLINRNQFDTISHERFSYLSFIVVEKLFLSHGLKIFNVEEYPTHGGSLRIYACHKSDISKSITSSVDELKLKEFSQGLTKIETYILFEEKVKETKLKILDFFIKLKQNKKIIVGYGAHAEAHTLLNYCGITTDFLEYTVDRNPYKQEKFLAGVHIPIFNPEKISDLKPEFIVILPWNIKKEIMKQMKHVGKWNGKFIILIPEVKLYNAEGSEIIFNNLQQEIQK